MTELEELVVSGESLAKAEVAGALQPYLRFTNDGQLLLEPRFDDLAAERRVLCVLLGLQALRMLGYRESDRATPSQLVEISGMAAGTVRPKLSSLLKRRSVAKDGSEYYLPLHAARKAISELEAGG